MGQEPIGDDGDAGVQQDHSSLGSHRAIQERASLPTLRDNDPVMVSHRSHTLCILRMFPLVD